MEKLSVIKAMIVSRNKTITQVANDTHLNQSHISQVILGKKNISKDHLLKLLEYLGYKYEQYQYLKKYKDGLEKSEMEYQQKWGKLLMQTTMFFLANYDLNKNEEQSFQKCIGGK